METKSNDFELPIIFKSRRAATHDKIEQLRERLSGLGVVCDKSFCVFATGSLARQEISEFSDLDLFVVGDKLRKLEKLRVLARLIEVNKELGFPEFSGDGEYLDCYEIRQFIDLIGTRTENSLNVFTARMLLLLESRPVYGDDAYERTIREVLDFYWRDSDHHPDDFLPIFLCNDVLRYWKELCVNYEASRLLGEETSLDKAKRRLKNYKLKHSRMLTCFSAIVYLCALVKRHGRCTLHDVLDMVKLTPVERLKSVSSQLIPATASRIEALYGQYAAFLSHTNREKNELLNEFSEQTFYDQRIREAKEFGDEMSKLVEDVGQDTRLFRYLLV